MRRIAALLVFGCFTVISCIAVAGNMTLSGKQIAGSGHAKNARTESNRLVLTQSATIKSVNGNAESYCIWSAVTPQNRTARSVLCGGKGRGSIIGQSLGPGTYTVLPGLNGKSSSYITIQFQ